MGYSGRRIKKTSSRLLAILYILMILCAIGILYSAIVLYHSRQEYRQGTSVYEQIGLVQKKNDNTEEKLNSSSEAELIDFKVLAQINPETAGWLFSENTIIDYPVVQGKDNEYYLTHLFNGEKNKMGCLFIDYRNSRDFSDKNTIIYGHNMKNGSMFASLTNYQSQSYYEEHSTIRLYTPQYSFNLELFADMVGDGSQAFVRLDFDDDNDFYTYISKLKAGAAFKSKTVLQPQDRIVTLSTCTYNFSNARYVLFARLSPITKS